MIKVVIFDVGGVLIRTQDPTPRRSLEIQHGLQPGQAEAIVFNSEMGHAAQRGEITTQQLWAWVGQHLSLSAQETAAFQAAFFAGDCLDTDQIDFIRSLRPR